MADDQNQFGDSYYTTGQPDVVERPQKQPPPNYGLAEAMIGGKKYKFTAQTPKDDPLHNIESYSAQDTGAPAWPEMGNPKPSLTHELEQVLGGTQNPEDISPHEYDVLTEQASKGNTLAQKILVQGKYKAKDYPTLTQDLAKGEDPFVQALSGLPALAQNEQAGANQTTQPYDFSNAEGQVNNLLGQMGSTMQMTTTPETNTYINSLQGILNQGKNNLTTSNLGLPSIMTALGGLGPAGKVSEEATPYASLLSALLSHQQYEDVYGTGLTANAQQPEWLQNALAAITGTTLGGGLVAPSIAAAGAGTIPSSSSTPTGSNG